MIEIVPVKRLDAEISVSGSKYVANRALMAAVLAEGTSTIKNMPDNDDINAAISALKQFGAKIQKEDERIIIHGMSGSPKDPEMEIDVHDSGTLMRFISGFASLTPGKTRITGSSRIQQRPAGDLLKGLRDLGAECGSSNNTPPLTIGGKLKGGTTRMKGDVSSQFISSLLLASPYAAKDVIILVEGEIVSRNYVDLTIDVMRQFGVHVERQGYEKFVVRHGQSYAAREFVIPADWSSANYFFAAAAIVPGTVKIENLDMESKQESGFVDVLAKMGCRLSRDGGGVEITGNNNLMGVDVDMSDMPDSVQTLAAVSCFAKGITTIRNIGHLKHKESDRINDTLEELQKLGIKATSENNRMVIEGGSITPGIIDTHNDHRMAMSFALIGLREKGLRIQNPECVNKSFPLFWDKLEELGATIKNA